jgi:thiamine kinase-like enzyme
LKHCIEIINKALNKEVITPYFHEGFGVLLLNSVGFLHTAANKKLINKLLKIGLFSRIFHTLKTTGLYSKNGFFFIKSLNGCVVIDVNNEKVYKILNRTLEPDFIDNEQRANSILPSVAPKIFESFVIDNFSVVVQELIYKKEVLSWVKWDERLMCIFPLMISKSNHIQRVQVKAYLDYINAKLSIIDKEDEYFKSYSKSINRSLQILFNRYSKDVECQYKIFSHGDLTPNNVMVTNNSYRIIDFANGGNLSYSYDLMLQNFYFIDKKTWLSFDKILFKKNEQKGVFFGLSKYYFSLLEEVYGIMLTENSIKLSLVISLAEIYIKNNQRYQSDEEYKNGIEIMENISHICHSIRNS